MTKDEAMDLALEALEHMLEDAKQERLTVEYWNECVDAITAIKQARSAQPALVQEGRDWSLLEATQESLREHMAEIKRLKEAQQAPVQPVALRDALAGALTSTYVCGRVWDAWNVGTMTEDDFQPAAECDELLDELVEAVAKATPPAQPAVPDALTSADIQEHIEYVAGWNDCRQAMLEMMK